MLNLKFSNWLFLVEITQRLKNFNLLAWKIVRQLVFVLHAFICKLRWKAARDVKQNILNWKIKDACSETRNIETLI